MHNEQSNNIDKKAVSPLIATVLLIGFALALAVIIVFWGRGILMQQLEKTGNFAQGKLGCEDNVEIDVSRASCQQGTIVTSVENLKDEALPNLRGRVIGSNSVSSSMAGVNLNGNEKKNIAFVYDTSKVGTPKAIEVIPVLYTDGDNPVSCDAQKITIETENC